MLGPRLSREKGASMSRPEVFEDLSEWDRKDHTFLDVSREYITEDVTVGAAVLALIDACRKSDVFTVSEDGEFKVSLPMTATERENALKNAQNTWDYREKTYNNLYAAERQVESWARYQIDNWAKEEGLEAPDWERHDALFEAVPA